MEGLPWRRLGELGGCGWRGRADEGRSLQAPALGFGEKSCWHCWPPWHRLPGPLFPFLSLLRLSFHCRSVCSLILLSLVPSFETPPPPCLLSHSYSLAQSLSHPLLVSKAPPRGEAGASVSSQGVDSSHGDTSLSWPQVGFAYPANLYSAPTGWPFTNGMR